MILKNVSSPNLSKNDPAHKTKGKVQTENLYKQEEPHSKF
ncbi:hypothetical protein J2T12_003174 [Paenibacillus anaericanus]|nr:hypothetical protein [Paenibacillus anaericanus]